jgi:hypothetical protein
MPLTQVIDLPAETLIDCEIDRATRKQTKIGGTDYTFDKKIFDSILMAVQTASFEEIEWWAQRGVKVGYRAYTNVPISNIVFQGDRIKDGRYSDPDVYYIVAAPPEDMGGVGVLWKVYCNLL